MRTPPVAARAGIRTRVPTGQSDAPLSEASAPPVAAHRATLEPEPEHRNYRHEASEHHCHFLYGEPPTAAGRATPLCRHRPCLAPSPLRVLAGASPSPSVKSPVAAPVYPEASGPLSPSTACTDENPVILSHAEQHLPNNATAEPLPFLLQ
jgi:hypothetical protein